MVEMRNASRYFTDIFWLSHKSHCAFPLFKLKCLCVNAGAASDGTDYSPALQEFLSMAKEEDPEERASAKDLLKQTFVTQKDRLRFPTVMKYFVATENNAIVLLDDKLRIVPVNPSNMEEEEECSDTVRTYNLDYVL